MIASTIEYLKDCIRDADRSLESAQRVVYRAKVFRQRLVDELNELTEKRDKINFVDDWNKSVL